MSSTSLTASTLFIDLASFAELEGFLYGGPNAITWFVGTVQKSNWFAFIPIHLRHTGTIDFGQKNVSASINRSADYVMSIWFRAQIPQITIVQPAPPASGQIFLDASLRWTRNLMHNLFERVSITFNELTVQEWGSVWMDFNFQFRVRGSKRVGYRNIIGDIASMTNPVGLGVPLGTGGFFSCPFPLWFGEESGVALPVAALPFNDIKLNYHFRDWAHLVVVYPGTAAVGGPGGPGTGRAATTNDVYIFGSTSQHPQLFNPNTFAHYALVHNDERVKMGDAPRDIVIHQVQEAQPAPFKDISSRTHFDIRFSHPIVLYCFAARNNSIYTFGKGSFGAEWSNYTTEPDYTGLDPIAYSELLYENVVRVAGGSDYYSLIAPFYFSDAIPDETGYHFYPYSIHPWDPLKPAGSTNYSKLANISQVYDMSQAAQAAAGIGTASGFPEDQNGNLIQYPNSAGVLEPMPLTLVHDFIARNWNIGRVANGSFGHPTL